MVRIFQLLLIVLALVTVAGAAEPSWERLVKEGNLECQRGRYESAIKSYKSALKILEKLKVEDLRVAVIHKDLAYAHRQVTQLHWWRLHDGRGSKIYKKELTAHQLGSEYTSKEELDLSQVVLKPACPLCHENYKVIPIRYGKDSGYEGEIPGEEDYKFTHKPGGPKLGCERWYCKDCLQKF